MRGRRNGNHQMGGQFSGMAGRQRAQRRDGTCRFERAGRAGGVFGRGICMDLEYAADNKEFLTQQKEVLEQRINCVNEQLENLE